LTRQYLKACKGQSSRRVQVKFYCNEVGNYQIHANVLDGTGFGNLPQTWVYFDATHYSSYITFTANSSVPGSVGIRNFRWNWYVTINDDPESKQTRSTQTLWIETTGYHTYYTLLATPQNPMSPPWTDVLDYSCDWASGQTYIESAANQITSSLYASGFNYETSQGAPGYGDCTIFYLTDFNSDIGSSNAVNCLDMAKAVVTYSNAIGCNLNLTTYGRTASGENWINYPLNCIDPIGAASPTNNPFSSPLIGNDCRSGGFEYHAFAERTSNNNVWDATLKYDTDSDPDNVTGSNPGCGTVTSGYSWTLPVNQNEATYIDRLLDDWPQWYSSAPRWNRNRNFSIE